MGERISCMYVVMTKGSMKEAMDVADDENNEGSNEGTNEGSNMQRTKISIIANISMSNIVNIDVDDKVSFCSFFCFACQAIKYISTFWIRTYKYHIPLWITRISRQC